MCFICRQTPCHPRCPNATPPKVRGTCADCGEDLTEDYTYYTDGNGQTFCSEECACRANGIKEAQWEDEAWK
ncbi:MAG TPA: hypothetical protein DD391_07375 [Clostridiales bacterium]|jgi:hypothetical protein|nr:hypothetical protein [Clostridiales bacterium]HBL82400.1 hypothetical protein [Clostridiales bacterium]